MRIARLRKEHLRGDFDCGVPELNEFLHRYARQNDEKGLSRTYVATRGAFIVGYITIRAGEFACGELPPAEQKGLSRYPIPVLRLARLAVDKTARGQRLGEQLLVFALRKAVSAGDQVGLWAVEVFAKNGEARRFYERYGFQSLIDDPQHLYMPLRTVRRALG